MSKPPVFDEQEAHKYFSAHCFNKTWNFIDKPARTVEEGEEMLRTCLASLWHWSQRTDVSPTNLCVGYWQASRVFALLGKTDDARRYGKLSLEHSKGLEPFYEGYAYEALARSEMTAGDQVKMNDYLSKAQSLCAGIVDRESKKTPGSRSGLNQVELVYEPSHHQIH